MEKELLLTALAEDAEEGNGEIVCQDKDSVTYFDYDDDIEFTFRYAESCTDEYVKSLIYLGQSVKDKGLTEDFTLDVLKKAFGSSLPDAVCTLSGIIIPSDEDEFFQMMDECNRAGDELMEFYDYDSYDDKIGMMFYQHQIVFVNEPIINRCSDDLGDEIFSADDEYQTGILMTLIHEVRHQMLDCNHFLPEDEYPVSEQAEERVEEFGRDVYETLGSLQYWR